MEKICVVLIVSSCHQTHFMEVPCENFGVLINGSILNNAVRGFLDLSLVVEPTGQEEHLKIERPSVHVVVKIGQIWIVVDSLEIGLPFEVVRQDSSERTLSGSNITGNCDVFLSWVGQRLDSVGLNVRNSPTYEVNGQ